MSDKDNLISALKKSSHYFLDLIYSDNNESLSVEMASQQLILTIIKSHQVRFGQIDELCTSINDVVNKCNHANKVKPN